MWKKIKAWWTKTERLEAEIVRLRADRIQAVEALKRIATGAARDPVEQADRVLRGLGYTPAIVTPDCPPDRIYFMPRGMGGRPTDYF